MDKKYVIPFLALGAGMVIGEVIGFVVGAPSDMEILDMAANMPAERLKAAARTTTAEIKEANAKADSLNARKTVILAVQDANS